MAIRAGMVQSLLRRADVANRDVANRDVANRKDA
jgi:hypothetical protein